VGGRALHGGGAARNALLERLRKAIQCARKTEIRALTKRVLLALLEFHHGQTWEAGGGLVAWPSVGRLARIIDADETNVRKALRQAEQRGVIVRIRQGGRGTGNRYRFSEEWLAKSGPHLEWAWDGDLDEKGGQNRSGFDASQNQAESLATASEIAPMPERNRSPTRAESLAEHIDKSLDRTAGVTLDAEADPSHSSTSMPVAIGGERAGDQDELRLKAKRVVLIFPPERRGNVDEAVRVLLDLAQHGVDLDAVAAAARSCVERTNEPHRYCARFLKWLEGDPWQGDWASARSDAAEHVWREAAQAKAEAVEIARQAAQAAQERVQEQEAERRRAYEASSLYQAPRTEWEGKKGADAAFDALRYKFLYRGNHDEERTYYLAICYEGLATPAQIEEAATPEIYRNEVLQRWLPRRFPLSGAKRAAVGPGR
jgi:hypothetical protein